MWLQVYPRQDIEYLNLYKSSYEADSRGSALYPQVHRIIRFSANEVFFLKDMQVADVHC